MSTIATTNFKILSAKGFIGNIINDENKVYSFFGRSHPWLNENLSVSPTSPKDHQLDYYSADRDIIALNKINPSNVSHVIPRKNWTPYKVYDQWNDEDESIWEKDFYVMNSDFVIYKCLRTPINRNTGLAIASTEEPNHLPVYDTFGLIDMSDDPKQYDDGYIWKFMYQLSEFDLKFLTFDYMPIRYYDPNETYVGLTTIEQLNADAQKGALLHKGKIYAYSILQSGLNYSENSTVSIFGDGTSASATVYTSSNGSITTIEVDEDTGGNIIGAGSDYHYANVIVEDSGSGLGSSVKAIISPFNGHGSNPVEELGAYFVGINSEFRNSTTVNSDIQINTKYRQVGLIENPEIETSTFNSADGLNANISITVTLEPTVNSITNLQYIYDSEGNKIAYIDGIETVSNDSTGNIVELRVHRTEDTVYVDFDSSDISDLYLENENDPFGTIISVVDSEYVHYSGNILFLENRAPIERNPNQVEQIRFVVEF